VPNKIALQTTPRSFIQPMMGSCGMAPGNESTLLLSLNDHKPGVQFPQPQGAPLPDEQQKKQRGGPRKQVPSQSRSRCPRCAITQTGSSTLSLTPLASSCFCPSRSRPCTAGR
jgi:hypothetical protein|tara:strand:- start:182 stop:520 length:339 start_codon:yes stop_codon:yes gene_type:complete